MHRFFIPQIFSDQKFIKLTDHKEIHHLKNVLRHKKGDDIEIFDRKGGQGQAQITQLSDSLVELTIQAFQRNIPDRPPICLACAIPKRAKFETIIEKCTELGVDEIIPLQTKRSEVNLKGERARKKKQRYQAIAINAAKQCQRKTVPEIKDPVLFPKALELINNNGHLALIAVLSEKQKTIANLLKKNYSFKRIIIFVGPEGDFTKDELELAFKHKCEPVTLGPTTLKVDTAAIISVALISQMLHERKS